MVYDTGIASDADGTEPLDHALAELYGALDSELRTLAAIGVRTTLDIAAEILGIDPDLSFNQKLNALVEQKLIREADRDHFHVLIDAGSASVHRGWQPSVEDLDVLVDPRRLHL